MKINELLVESQQLDEGPFTQAIGKGAGKVARGIANVGKDLKAGFKAGYSGQQPADAAATTDTTAAPATTAAATTQTAPVKKAAPAKAAAPAADTAEPETTPAAAPAAADNAGADAAAVKKELDNFLATYKKDLEMQNKNWEFVTPKVNALEKQVADLVAAGSAAAPAAEVPAAEPETKRRGGKVAGELSQSPSAVRRREQRAANKKSSQSEIDADRDRLMGNMNDSIERHKQRMVAEGLANGTISIFKR